MPPAPVLRLGSSWSYFMVASPSSLPISVRAHGKPAPLLELRLPALDCALRPGDSVRARHEGYGGLVQLRQAQDRGGELCRIAHLVVTAIFAERAQLRPRRRVVADALVGELHGAGVEEVGPYVARRHGRHVHAEGGQLL